MWFHSYNGALMELHNVMSHYRQKRLSRNCLFFIGQNCATWFPPAAGDSREAGILAGYTAVPNKISVLLVRKTGDCTVNKQLVVAATEDLNSC